MPFVTSHSWDSAASSVAKASVDRGSVGRSEASSPGSAIAITLPHKRRSSAAPEVLYACRSSQDNEALSYGLPINSGPLAPGDLPLWRFLCYRAVDSVMARASLPDTVGHEGELGGDAG